VVLRLAVVAGVSVLAVLAVASGRVVATLLAHSSAPPARLLEHLHAEAALGGVVVTFADCTGEGSDEHESPDGRRFGSVQWSGNTRGMIRGVSGDTTRYYRPYYRFIFTLFMKSNQMLK